MSKLRSLATLCAFALTTGIFVWRMASDDGDSYERIARTAGL